MTALVIILNNVLPSITILISATSSPKAESTIVTEVVCTKCPVFYTLCDSVGPFSIIFCWCFLDFKPRPKPSQAGIKYKLE